MSKCEYGNGSKDCPNVATHITPKSPSNHQIHVCAKHVIECDAFMETTTNPERCKKLEDSGNG